MRKRASMADVEEKGLKGRRRSGRERLEGYVVAAWPAAAATTATIDTTTGNHNSEFRSKQQWTGSRFL